MKNTILHRVSFVRQTSFKFLTRSFALLMLLALGSSSLWAVTGTINFGSGAVAIDKATVTGDDNQENTWTITSTAGSYTQSSGYSQVGSSKNACSALKFSMSLPSGATVTSFEAKFGGSGNGAAGTANLNVDGVSVANASWTDATDKVLNSGTISKQGALTITFSGLDKGVKCYYIKVTYTTAASKIDVTLSRNGVTETKSNQTSPYTLPAAASEADACTDWVFKGWSTSPVTSTTTEPSYVTSVSTSTTVYAVYGKTESSGGTTSYSKVTTVAGIVAGTYAIAVNKVNSSKYNFANGSAASGHAGVEGTGVTTADSYTSLPTGAKEYELSGNNTDGFTIKETSSKTYLVGTESKASLSYSSTASEKWTFALSGQGFHLTGKQGSKMSCNSTTAASAIRNYASSSSFYDPIYFFIKSTGGSTTTYTTSPNCVTKKVSSISVKTPPTTTTYTEGDSFDPAGMVIHVVYDDASTEDITSGFTVTPDPLTKTTTKVTISYGGKTTTQSVTVEEKVVEEYVLITSVDDLEAGVKYLIGNGTSDACKFVSTEESANNRRTTSGTVTNSKVEKTEAMMALELGGSTGAWTFKTIGYEGTAGYLNATSTTKDNYLKVQSASEYSNFSISFSGNAAVITCTGKTSRNIIRANGDIISCYTSGQSSVYLYKENSTKPRVSVSPASLTAAKPNTGSDQVTATAKNFAGTVTYSWTTSDDNVATVSGSGATAIVTYKNSGTCTITVTATDGATTKTATVAVTVPQVYKVTWDVNGSTTDQYYLLTESPVMPDAPEENCGTKVFVGWTNAPILTEQAVAPIALYTDQSDFTSLKTAATYYAVFADESETSNTYSLIGDEEDLTSDDYVINASYGSNDYALGTNIDASGKIPGTVVTDNKGKITLTSGQESLVWTITRDEDNELTFKNKSTNQYLNIVSSGSYGKLELGNLGDASKYTFTNKTHGLDYADSWIFKSENISGQQLEHYQGNFQAYKSQAEDIYLYKKVLSYTAFTTVCGPTIRVDECKYIVSGKDITIKSANIPVSGNNLESATTLSVTRKSGSANLSAMLNNATVSGGVTTNASLVISYHPTAFNTTETATFEIKDNLGQTSALFEIIGISLPEKFVIASKVDDQWYSLPGNLDLFDTYSGVPTTMDNADNPTHVAVVDPIAAYSVMALTNSADVNDRLIHLSSLNTGILCVSTTSSETGIRNYANKHANELAAVSRWTIATLDGVSYTITSASKSSPLRYNRSGNKLWGMYASGTETFRIIPITNLTDECVYLREPMALKAVALASTATLTFKKIPGATNYEYSLNNGSSWADVASFAVNTSDKNYIDAVVDGLMSSTSYTILLRAKSVTNVCATPVAASVNIKTAACDDTPLLGGEAATTTTTATISWTCRATTSDIVFYTDDTYSVEATTPAKITGVSSPYTITDLTKNTTYYYKVFAGGTCESVGSSFLTATPEVEVVNWNPDYIDLDLNIDGTPAAVIQKQVTEGTGEDVYADDIFFSKYFEAKSSLKLIGIYNGTAAPVSLNNVIITYIKVADTKTGAPKTATWKIKDDDLDKTMTLNLSPLGEIPAKTEYIFYTVTNSELAIAQCIQDAVGWDKDNWFPTDQASATIISDQTGKTIPCKFLGGLNGTTGMKLQFNGTHAVSMWRGDKMIDLIGRGDENGADGSEIIKAPKGCVKINGEIQCDVPLNDDYGWYCADGIDYETKDSSALSTNRFLLIRKNIVRAGYSTPAQIESMTTHGVSTKSAVSSNGDNFNTLCTEWEGRAIGYFSGEDDATTTCENFNLVSDFNYSNYYTSFKNIGDTVLLNEHNQNPDGTFRLYLEDLDSLSCQPLKIKVFNGKGGETMFEREYTVPIMIMSNSTTNSDYFSLWNEGNNHSIPTPRSEEECKKCNVVVLNNVTLTKDSKVPEVHDITVYPGAQLIVPNGQTLKANTITFRRENDEVPSAYLYNNSSLDLSATTEVYFNFRLDAKNWYWLTLPYACNVNDVTFSSGYKATYGIDWFLKYYDGEIRAANRSGGWQLVPAGTTLEPGVGYIIGIADDPNPDYKAELRFPMAQYSEQGTKNVGVRNWGEDKADPADYNNIQSNELTPNNKGWQLVGNPFFAFDQNTLSGQDILKGSLSQVSLEPNGYTYKRSGTNRYITITDDHGSSYTQVLASSKKLPPFTSYFVQIGVGSGAATPVKDYSLAFNASERTQDKTATAPARRMLMHAEDEMDNMNTDEPVFVGLSIVAPNGELDETALAINDQYELDKYEMGFDLAKWKGDSYTRLKKPLIYTMAGTNERSFNAMARNESEQMIPVGFYAYNTDAYTVQFNPTYTEYLGSIQELTLYDAVMNTYTDLLKYDYTFVPNKKGDCKDRLFIIAKIAERIDVQTGMGKASILTDEICKFITPDGQLHVARKGVIYDAQGRIEQVIR